MPGHSQNVFDSRCEFEFRKSLMKLFGNIEKHRIELLCSTADAVDLVRRFYRASVPQSDRSINDFCFRKISRDLVISTDRQHVQLEADGLTWGGDQSRQFRIGL